MEAHSVCLVLSRDCAGISQAWLGSPALCLMALLILNQTSRSVCQIDCLLIDIEGSVPYRAIGKVLDLCVVDTWVSRVYQPRYPPWLDMAGGHCVVIERL